jgi:hypothetical protein
MAPGCSSLGTALISGGRLSHGLVLVERRGCMQWCPVYMKRIDCFRGH